MHTHEERWANFARQCLLPMAGPQSAPYQAMRHAYACAVIDLAVELLGEYSSQQNKHMENPLERDPLEHAMVKLSEALQSAGRVAGIEVIVEVAREQTH